MWRETYTPWFAVVVSLLLFFLPKLHVSLLISRSITGGLMNRTLTNANMFCLDPEKAGPAMIILLVVAVEDQFGAELIIHIMKNSRLFILYGASKGLYFE